MEFSALVIIKSNYQSTLENMKTLDPEVPMLQPRFNSLVIITKQI